MNGPGKRDRLDKVLIVGAGSAGSRHGRLLSELGFDIYVFDPDQDRAGAVPDAKPWPAGLDDVSRFDGIVIASPSSLHAEHARAALASTAKILVEKPLGHRGPDAEAVAAAAGDRVAVAYNLRLYDPVMRVAELIQSGVAGRPLFADVWFGSYLPDWRPGSDYRQTYSATRELGGGVLLDATHELDLLTWLFTDPISVIAADVSRLGDLEIDVEDTVSAVLRDGDGARIRLSLDYLSRRYRRGIQVVGEEATIRLDWARNVIELESNARMDVQEISEPISESYRRQADRFASWLGDGAQMPVMARQGVESVRLADEIRESAA